MLPNRNGVYLAQPTAIGLEEKSTGSVQAGITLRLIEYRGVDGKTSEPVDFQITSYLNIIKRDGNFNDINVRALQDSFGWNTADGFGALTGMDLSEVTVQAVVADGQDQNGNTRKEVKYINPRDYSGSPGVKSDPVVAQSLDAKYGAKLRAIAKPSSAVSKPKTAPGTLDGAGTDIGKQAAWAKFVSKVDAYGRENPSDAYSNAERTDTFKKLAASFAQGMTKDPKSLTAQDFAKLTAEIDTNFDPATRDFLPF